MGHGGGPKKFGTKDGPDPVAAGRKGAKNARPKTAWSIRNAARYLAAKPLDEVKKMAKHPDKLTVAQAIAIAKMKSALDGNTSAMQQFTDDVDGKQVERQVQVAASLEDLVTGSEEYDNEYRREIEDGNDPFLIEGNQD